MWPAIVTQVAVIVAPAFIAAQNYMLVGRLMSYLGAQYSPMPHMFITKVSDLSAASAVFVSANRAMTRFSLLQILSQYFRRPGVVVCL